VLYVFRTLVDDDIPLNSGCLKPLQVIIPPGSMLNPHPPAATVAGNVETSQCLTDALYGALGLMGASYGTMNNFTFGNDRYQYYETVSGGTGAGDGFDGTDTVQAHMTNSRLTDPEVLEWRYPVRIDAHTIRLGSGGAGKWHGGNGATRRSIWNGGWIAGGRRQELGGARRRIAHAAHVCRRDFDGRGRRVRHRYAGWRRLRHAVAGNAVPTSG
jgi:N-methylhydantoinase B/oxoprolinase/acetone carboxylase alpha subunit